MDSACAANLRKRCSHLPSEGMADCDDAQKLTASRPSVRTRFSMASFWKASTVGPSSKVRPFVRT